MTVWVLRNGEWIDKNLAPPLHPVHATAPGVIRDTMEPTLCPANGRRYDSKRSYEKAVRAAGCEIIGNENPIRPPKEFPTITEQEVAAIVNALPAKKATKRRKNART